MIDHSATRDCSRCSLGTEKCVFGDFWTCGVCDVDRPKAKKRADTEPLDEDGFWDDQPVLGSHRARRGKTKITVRSDDPDRFALALDKAVKETLLPPKGRIQIDDADEWQAYCDLFREAD